MRLDKIFYVMLDTQLYTPDIYSWDCSWIAYKLVGYSILNNICLHARFVFLLGLYCTQIMNNL